MSKKVTTWTVGDQYHKNVERTNLDDSCYFYETLHEVQIKAKMQQKIVEAQDMEHRLLEITVSSWEKILGKTGH
jgi:hypothetical protein